MRFVLLAFLLLHSPTGASIYVSKDQIVAVTPAVGASPEAHAQIIGTGPTNIYVKETPDEVLRKIKEETDD